MEAHFRTVVREVERAGGTYRLYLDPDYAQFPNPLEGTEFAWLHREDCVEITKWSLAEALGRHGWPDRTPPASVMADFLLRALNTIFHPQGLALLAMIQNVFKRFKAFDSSQGFELSLSRGPISLFRSKPHASDFFRLDIASQYPNANFLYLDADVAICKPFSQWPLESSFVYEWPGETFANSAIMFMKSGDVQSRNGTLRIAREAGSFRPWKVFLRDHCHSLGINVLPMRLFDLPFCPDNSFCLAPHRFFTYDRDSEALVREIQDNSVAFHWHNQWDGLIEPGSPADVLSNKSR